MLLLLKQNYLRNKYICSGSVKELRTYIGKLKMTFKSGTFTNECRKSVNFVTKKVLILSMSQMLNLCSNSDLKN